MMRTAILLIWLFGILAPAHSAEQRFGPFAIDSERPGVIFLDGEIDVGAALNFRRAYDAAEDPEVLVLNSPGGIVQIGLLIADDVHRFELHTLIPDGQGCYSSCAFIFLAGHERRVEGELGVHQVSNTASDAESAQFAISDIIDVLNRFDTPVQVLTAMFRTPPEDMYVFSTSEIASLGLDRSPDPVSEETVDAAATAMPSQSSPQLQSLPSEKTRAGSVALGALDRLSRDPVRLAVYAGLDFYGEDISSFRAASMRECAERCLETSGECKAFTFNADDRVARGPNCFLKSARGQLDGNAVAISGLLLSRTQATPSSFDVGVIDPKSGLFEDVDIIGGDKSSTPAPGASTPLACRLTCVRDDACIAFTFVSERAQCWLKDRLGEPRYSAGMVSGLKKPATFAPIEIIELD
jgi:hypothetical protein